jgi:hypothetical protein
MILRDRTRAFVGSQSLRTMELDRRREVGIVFEDAAITGSIAETFLHDWKLAEEAKLKKAETDTPTVQMAKKVAKAVVKDLPDMMPLVETTLEEMGSNSVEMVLNAEELQDSVRDAVKHAVKSAVKEAAASEPAPAEQ